MLCHPIITSTSGLSIIAFIKIYNGLLPLEYTQCKQELACFVVLFVNPLRIVFPMTFREREGGKRKKEGRGEREGEGDTHQLVTTHTGPN